MERGGSLGVVVVGAGAFGRNHLRVYREMERAGAGVRLLALVDADAGARERAAAEFAVPGFATMEACVAAVGGPDAASVCVPTAVHAEVAEPLLGAGVHVLVEKPVAATLGEADRMVALAAEVGCVLQVGHLERFNPAVAAARGHLNGPMFFEAHRLSVFTPRSLDVDVVLDLMIHDLDIVLSMVDSEVREVRAVGLPVLSGKVDIANVRTEFENGCVANFTASRVSTERVRKLRFFQPHQYLSLDFARQDLLLIDVTRAAAGLRAASSMGPAAVSAAFASAGGGMAGLAMKKLEVVEGEPLRLEIEAFVEACREGSEPVVSGVDGRRALALALAINAAIAGHAARAGL